jgi:SSS family solute:Na+ symporter
MVLLVITTPASYQLMMGIVLAYSLQIPLLAGIAAGTVVSIAFVAGGGLRSDIYANTVQFVLMYAGMTALVFFAVRAFGSPSELWNALPESATTLPGTIGWTGVAGWFLIALQTFIDPNFYVRTVAAASEHVARRGLAISVACWMLFDALQLLAGLYVAAYAPATDPTISYLSFGAQVLPPVAHGLFVASLLAVVVSAVDGYALSSATMLAHDIGHSIGRSYSPLLRYRIALVLVASVGITVAYLVPSIIDIIFYGGSIAVSAVLLPLIMSFTKLAPRLRSTIVLQLTLPAFAAIISRISSSGEPIFVGLFTSAALTSLAILFTPHAKAARNTIHGL